MSQVTRLGKLINLIRRKVADVNKQLAKRLKKLVKQWQQLLTSRAPNGVVPLGGVATQSGAAPSAQVSVDSHAAVQTTPSPSTSSGIGTSSDQTPQCTTTLSSSDSNSVLAPSDSSNSLESRSSRPNSRAGTSPPLASPTPSSSTLSHAPVQPVAINPSKNRSKMMQKLSSFKKSPNKLHQGIDETLSAQHVTNQTESQLSAHAVVSVGDGNTISLASNTTWTPNDDLSRSLWTAGSFTDMITEDFANGSNWVPPMSPENSRAFLAATTCNGGERAGCQENFNKRPRSPSPADSKQSEPPHKRHKRLKHKPQLADCIVRIPLEKVHLSRLEGHRGFTDHRLPVEDHRGLISDRRGLTEKHNSAFQGLVVSFPRSLLARVPSSPSIKREAVKQDKPPPAPCQTVKHRTAQGAYQSHDQNLHMKVSEEHEPMDVLSAGAEDQGSPLIVIQRPPPEGACPGVDGCVGLDGYWYDWTDPMVSRDTEVTVMPYVYFEHGV